MRKTDGLLKKEYKDLLGKVLPVVQANLQKLKASGYQFNEIAYRVGINPPRLSESMQGKYLNDRMLALLIGGGIVKIQDLLKQSGDLTEGQRNYLMNMLLHEDTALKEAVLQAKQAGLNPTQILMAAVRTEKKKS